MLYVLLILLSLFQCSRILYRLYIHPLSHFPGPKLAAVTHLYGIYWTLVKKGQYTKMLPALHQRYGPIVRIYPNELHIYDIDAYNRIFSVGTKFDKQRPFYDHPLGEGSHFNMTDLKSAKTRRDMFAPFLSKAAVMKRENLISATVMKFISILKRYETEEFVDLTKGFHSLTIDLITTYGWEKPFGALDFPNFDYPLVALMNDLLVSSVIIRLFHGLARPIVNLAFYFPVLAKFSRMMAAVSYLRTQCQALVLDEIRQGSSDKLHPSIFSLILKTDQDRQRDISFIKSLTAEALVFLVGGEESTANTLIHGTFHVLHNPQIKGKLQRELFAVMPAGSDILGLEHLEKIPYLRAIVKESLRFSHGAPGRLPRVVPASGARICGEYIPPATIVSLSQYCYNTDASVFADPTVFDPDRWLGSNYQYLDRHLVSFSKGSRGCIGINLAYSELFLAFAYVFRFLDLELYNTKPDDMQWGDYYAPMTKSHLRVKILN